MVDKLRKREFYIDLGLAFIVGSFAFSLLTRAFSFYTLPHGLKLIFFVFNSLTIGLLTFRFLRPIIQFQCRFWKTYLAALGVAALVALSVFLLGDYQMAPIRTTHTLTITNPSDSANIRIDQFLLPGDELLQFSEIFPESRIENNQLFLSPGESITYSREMVGGIQFDARASESQASLMVEWNGVIRTYKLGRPDEITDVVLPGSSWGYPSLPYRLAGIVSILADWVSLLGGISLLVLLLFYWFIDDRNRQPLAAYQVSPLDPLTTSIILNGLILLFASAYAIFFDEQRNLLLVFFSVGVLLYFRDLIRNRQKWVYGLVIALMLAGIGVNGYFWFRPPHSLHQVIHLRPFDTFAYLADRIGAANATYLSIGYYRYLREAEIIIAEPLYDELLLSEGRLRLLNQLRGFSFSDYDYHLTDVQVDTLIKLGEWEVWPNRTGGEFFLLPQISAPGDTYVFFSNHLRFFLIPLNAIRELGLLDVSILY